MTTIVSLDDMAGARIRREHRDGTVSWRTNYMTPMSFEDIEPQAYLIEILPNFVVRPHFHAIDQFQLFVGGGGTIGNYPIHPYQLHFARKHTPYGPIIANDEGCQFLTLRSRRDAGAQYLPESREKLESVDHRNPWQVSVDIEFNEASADAAISAIPGVSDEVGLAAFTVSLPPFSKFGIPDSPSRGGQYIVVVSGRGSHGNVSLVAPAIVFNEPGSVQPELSAGAGGLRAIVLNFPSPGDTDRSPKHAEAAVMAAAGASTGLKTWMCVLCGFVYDEATGMPEHGILAGTTWGDVPEGWVCPDCSAGKSEFEMIEI